jgi:putative transcriptional regulator
MTDVKEAPKQDAAKPAEKPRTVWQKYDAYIMFFLGLLLFVIGGHFNQSPLVGHHQLLVASSSVAPEFKNSVIFLTMHTRGAAQGIIINKPGNGGPVEKKKAFALHTLDVATNYTQELADIGLGLVTDPKGIEQLKKAKAKPKWYIIVNGYAGWEGGQIEQEVAEGAWTLVEFDKDFVTKTPPAKMWDAAHKRAVINITH